MARAACQTRWRAAGFCRLSATWPEDAGTPGSVWTAAADAEAAGAAEAKEADADGAGADTGLCDTGAGWAAGAGWGAT